MAEKEEDSSNLRFAVSMMLRIKPRIVRARDGADSLCDIAKELVAGRSVALQFNWENLSQTVIFSAS